MSEKQTMKTAVHEVTHAMCHDRDLMEELGDSERCKLEYQVIFCQLPLSLFFFLQLLDILHHAVNERDVP